MGSRPPQYEKYFRELDQPKNLKKEEWRAVHVKLQELLRKGIETRIKVSGKVLDKKRLQRSSRNVFSGVEQSQQNLAGRALPLPPPNRIAIETRGPDGEWSTYSSENNSADTHSLALYTDHTILQTVDQPVPPSTFADNNPFMGTSYDRSLTFSPASFPYGSATFGLGDSPHQGLTNLRESIEVSLNSHQSSQYYPDIPSMDDFRVATADNAFPWDSDFGSYDSTVLPQYFDHALVSEFQTARSGRSGLDHNSHNQFPEYTGPSGHWSSQTLHRIPTQAHLRDVTEVLARNSMLKNAPNLPDAEDVLDSLLSLVPENSQQHFGQTSEISTKNAISDSLLRSSLLFSIANGFAGLKNIPPAVIFGILRKDSQMTSHILEYFKSAPSAQVKSLADNLFRAAIEACDEDAVRLIFHVTQGSSNAIDPNQTVCKINGYSGSYTPIEVAATFRHLGIVKILLAENADVNKTYVDVKSKDLEEYARGALERAVRIHGDFEAVDINLVQAILDSGAKVRRELIMAAIRWGQVDVIDKLIDRIPPAAPDRCWSSYEILTKAALYLENKVATQVVKHAFPRCDCPRSTCARDCPKCEDEMNKALRSAARRGNSELVEWFLSINTKVDGVLPAAIKSSNQEIIEYLLLRGISMVEECMLLEVIEITLSRLYKRYIYSFKPKTTALAEAIRSHDKNLIQRIEQLGALSYINDNDKDGHFEAALCAAAEIGDSEYIQMLLRRAPKKRGKYLTDALIMAICYDKTDSALVLIDNGASFTNEEKYGPECPVLYEAVFKQNRAVVVEILERHVGFQDRMHNNYSLMALAGRWGNLSVVEDLLFMGFGRATQALIVAVESRNNDLIKLLLERGADPSTRDLNRTPLKVAIQNDDSGTIQLLISHGARPADEGALLVAMEKNQSIFDTLLRLFSATYPFGLEGFGGSLLIEAIKKGDTLLLDGMIDAKFDLKAFCFQDQDQHRLLSPFGFAIKNTKGTDGGLALLQHLVGAGRLDLNCPVSHSKRNEGSRLETPLMVAVDTRSERVVELLLANGADIHQPAKRGINRTALQKACEIGSFKIVKLLLSKGTKVDEQPAYDGGATALQLAARSGSIKIAKLLLSKGARVHEAPAKVNGKTAFEEAAEHGRLEMLKLLWDAATAANTPFTQEQIESAKILAFHESHRGCVEYIQYCYAECLQSSGRIEPKGSGDSLENN
ncbi:Ankyrin repeat-containing domain protein [Rutstroemia sp. NJR-2017a BBW]|nr:Ankyrin repeat-containing domain protein [Rutstroemia sp. NJR-2017a BBW]